MSFEQGKKDGETVMTCDHKGCNKSITGKEGRGKLWVAAKSAGWMVPSAKEHYCPTHKSEHGARTPKKDKPAKKGKANLAKKESTKKGPKVVEFGGA